MDLLPHGKELDLVILKAHLLIEEQINLLVAERLKNPDVILDEERFESHYRIRLAQSFFPIDFQPWLWHALRQLNRLRNRVAHSLSPKGLNDIAEDVIRAVPGELSPPDAALQYRLEIALWSLFDAVSELVETRKATVQVIRPPNPEQNSG